MGSQGGERSSRGDARVIGRWPVRVCPARGDGVYNLLTEANMEAVPVQLDQDLVELLEELQRPAKESARELIVLELYRQGEVSSGRSAQLLGLRRDEFIRHASERGIPYLQLSGEELRREIEDSESL
jgi:predicted HTH domain antitoxin